MKRRILALALALAAPLTQVGPALAGEPSEREVIGHALQLMVERLDFLANASFGPTVVHPQPSGHYWAVVGEAISGALTGHMRHHDYVAAVRLICDDADDAKCWRLEKLAFDGRIVIDRK
jgi:hypothetical protein